MQKNMKSVLITIVTVCIGAVISAGVSRLEIEGAVQQIEFDSNSNLYVVASSDASTKLYKLDSTRNLTLEHSFQNSTDVIVTKSGNVYIFDQNSGVSIGSLYLLKPDSEEIIPIYETPLQDLNFVHFKDEKDNIFFNTLFGVALLRQDETVPTAIVNLEYFNIIDESTYAIDYSGNIHFGGIVRSKDLAFATFDRYETENSAPSAEFHALPNQNLNVLSVVGADSDGNVHVGFSGDQARIYKIYSYGFDDVEYAQYLHYYKSFYPTKDRFYFFAQNLYVTKECSLGFLSREDIFSPLQVTRVHQNLSSEVCDLGKTGIASDSNGNLFFVNGDQVLCVLNNETEVKQITFSNGSDLEVTSIAVDQNDDLWIVKGSLYVVRSNSTEAEELTVIFTPPVGSSSMIKISEETNEVFIGATNGLFLYTN